MTDKLCIAVCENFYREAAAVVSLEKWPDVRLFSFPALCGRPSLSWQEMAAADPDKSTCGEIHVLGSCCVRSLEIPQADKARCHVHFYEQCFYLVSSKSHVDTLLRQGAYLLTPGWLDNWQEQVKKMGFSQSAAREFFSSTTTKLVLLDTGIISQTKKQLSDFSSFVNLPTETVKIGLDFIQLLLNKIVVHYRESEQDIMKPNQY